MQGKGKTVWMLENWVFIVDSYYRPWLIGLYISLMILLEVVDAACEKGCISAVSEKVNLKMDGRVFSIK